MRSILLFPSRFLKILRFFFICFCLNEISPLYSTPDLTVIGFINPNDGLGKVPIAILETLGNNISANFIVTSTYDLEQGLPLSVMAALNNSDKAPGKVALLTSCIWYSGAKPAALIPPESLIKLAYSMHESTHIPKMWVKILNEEFDAVVVPDPFLIQVYQDSGVHIPIFALPIPMMLAPYFAHSPHPSHASKPFVFGDASANKNPRVLVKAFAKAFKNNPNVHLVMRAGHIHPETRDIINGIITKYALTNVTIEDGFLSLEQYINRILSFDCYVNLSKGEGFSFIPRETLSLGIPTIITNNTASKTICNSGYVRAVPSHFKVPSPYLYQVLFNEPCGEQFGCKVEDVIVALQDVYKHYELYIKKARKGRKWVRQYDCTNPILQDSYLTLVKPKQVKLGNKNSIENGAIMTNSIELYQKYEQLIESNAKNL
jgi:glycosyltransferase involved in cell wall biosynthesis